MIYLSQSDYTCENSFGWSRIDRAYNSLHAADVSTMRTTCNILEYPRHLSDHRPRKKHKGRKRVPQGVTTHASFREELEAEYRIRQYVSLRAEKRTPSPFDNLRTFKENSYTASGFIRRACGERSTSWQYTRASSDVFTWAALQPPWICRRSVTRLHVLASTRIRNSRWSSDE